ncbi:MAG TPA: hypothetical protein VFA43_12165 [Gemmatimonadaceae bacterium]|nr:hypothetical protein [Gemmatimonadaceae bacterium]
MNGSPAVIRSSSCGRDLTFSDTDQFSDDVLWLTPTRSYDPNLESLTYRWPDASGADLVTPGLPPSILPICSGPSGHVSPYASCVTSAALRAGARRRSRNTLWVRLAAEGNNWAS